MVELYLLSVGGLLLAELTILDVGLGGVVVVGGGGLRVLLLAGRYLLHHLLFKLQSTNSGVLGFVLFLPFILL